MTILKFIEVMRNARPDNGHYFMNGGCWEFFRVLRSVFPEAQPYHTWTDLRGHVATKIGDHLYDIRGRIRRPSLYEPMTRFGFPGIDGDHKPHRWCKSYKANIE